MSLELLVSQSRATTKRDQLEATWLTLSGVQINFQHEPLTVTKTKDKEANLTEAVLLLRSNVFYRGTLHESSEA